MIVFVDRIAGGGVVGGFRTEVGLKPDVWAGGAGAGLGACLEAANAYEGAVACLEVGGRKLKVELGALRAFASSVRDLSMLSSRASTASGILHPNALVPARSRVARWSSTSFEKRVRRKEGMLVEFSTRSRAVAARILMSAAVSEPREEIFSPPFFGRRMDSSMIS